jgi:hypothetical protein
MENVSEKGEKDENKKRINFNSYGKLNRLKLQSNSQDKNNDDVGYKLESRESNQHVN